MLKVISNITKDIQDTFSFKIWVKTVEALKRHHHENPKAGSISFAYSMKSQK